MKVYVLKYDFRTRAEGDGNDVIGVYPTHEDAVKAFEDMKNEIDEELRGSRYEDEVFDDPYESEDNHWLVESGEFDEFQELTIVEKDMQPTYHSWELQTDVETKAINEIREMLGKTGENTWSFGADATGRYNGDIPYVMAHHVMQDDTICEIGIEDISIDDDNNLVIGYHVCNDDEIGGERYEDNLITCVMPQYYQEIAHELWNGMKG